MTLVLSLFPGLGLLDRAFEEEGFCVVRGPDVLWGGDIRRFHPPAGKFDGLIGGPPCQAFSPLSNLVRARGYEPRFGNLIPEYERCVREAAPLWFVMEEVAQAPEPRVDGYSVLGFTLCNSALDSGDGFGEEQERVRRWSFGVLGSVMCDLRGHINLAALRLPKARTVTQACVNNDPTRKRKATVVWNAAPGQRRPTVTNRAGLDSRGDGERFTLEECIRLQGLPVGFLDDAPFTIGGKRRGIANGVPLPMGRAIARAVKQALAAPSREEASA